MKTFKMFLDEKGITSDAFAAKEASEVAALYSEYNTACFKSLQDGLDGKASKDEMPNIDETLKGYVAKDVFEAVKTQLAEATEAIATMKESISAPAESVSLKESIRSVITKNADAILAMKNDRNASLVLKVVGPMTFGTNVTGRVGRQEREAGSTGVTRRNPWVLDIVNVGTTNAAAYNYVERTGHEGGPTMTAEGALKPQADWDYIERTAVPKKIPVIVTVSKEMLADIDGIVDDVYMEITEQINLFADAGLLTGDGIGTNLVGIDANATAFAPGALLLNLVPFANAMDVLRAAVGQVRRQLYEPTYVMCHPDVSSLMDLEKTVVDGIYLLPAFTSVDNQVISGVRLITNTGMGVDDFLVGDFTKFKVKVREGLNIDVGYRGAQDDWAKNFVSFLGEMRLSSFIPENHFGAIVKGDFTSAKALLLKP